MKNIVSIGCLLLYVASTHSMAAPSAIRHLRSGVPLARRQVRLIDHYQRRLEIQRETIQRLAADFQSGMDNARRSLDVSPIPLLFAAGGPLVLDFGRELVTYSMLLTPVGGPLVIGGLALMSIGGVCTPICVGSAVGNYMDARRCRKDLAREREVLRLLLQEDTH